MFTIGEFSKLTGLTVKTLRFYHEEQLLIPVHVDRDSGYTATTMPILKRACRSVS